MLEIRNLSITLGEFCLENISIGVGKGDYYVLLGKSGVGKTVLLEIIAGLIKPDTGSIFLNGHDITNEKIQKRKVGIVFQDFSVFPHLTVKQNISYPLKGKGYSKTEKEKLIHQYAKMTEIEHLLKRGTQNLSGGELQRVALARMLVAKPECILLDEPLASMDVQLKGGLRNLLRQINKNGTTILHVTHDYEEAIALSNKVAVLHDGTILQKGTTREVFKKPANEFVANFTGVRNFFSCEFQGNMAKVNGTLDIAVDNKILSKKGNVIIRGEDITLSKKKSESSATNNFSGKIKQIIPYLNNYEIIVDTGFDLTAVISEQSLEKLGLKEGDEVWVAFKSTAVRIIE